MDSTTEASALLLSADEVFKHALLDHTKPSIRLICVLRATPPASKIRCEISHGTTSDTYNCLSYRWGDQCQPRQSIKLNDMAFSVHQNLYDFLDRMATKITTDKTDPYWIDALCIDQANVLERNHQVGQMGVIYTQAMSVHIWLGSMPDMIPVYRALMVEEGSRPLRETIERTKFLYRQWNLVNEQVLNNPYWERAWITQEVFLARKLFMLSDEHMLPISTFVRYMKSHGFPDDDAFYTPMSAPVTLISPFTSGTVLERLTMRYAFLIDLLEDFGERECQIPRDRIFSLLSLCKQGERVNIDYALPDVDLMYEVLKNFERPICLCHALLLGQCLGILETIFPRRVCVAEPYLEYDFELPSHEGSRTAQSSSQGILEFLREPRNFVVLPIGI
jgi:hypothetical protein